MYTEVGAGGIQLGAFPVRCAFGWSYTSIFYGYVSTPLVCIILPGWQAHMHRTSSITRH